MSILRDIEFARAGGQALLLDAQIPQDGDLHPAAIALHGGGWTRGDKAHDMPYLDALTDAGIAWFSINYRLAPQHPWPACLDDTLAAIRWVKSHAREYRIDPHRIALIGYSAGGQLVALAGQMEKVQAIVTLATPFDFVFGTARGGYSDSLKQLFHKDSVDLETLEILWQASPINHLTSTSPPMLLIRAGEDQAVAIDHFLHMQKRLSDLGIAHETSVVQGAPHSISQWDSLDPTYKQTIVDFLKHL